MKTLDLTNIDEVISELEKADDSYFNSDKELLTDAEYDQLKRTAQKLSPKHPYFVKVGAEIRGGKLKLPYPMNGLEQLYNENLSKYILENKDNELIISDKLDGVSCMLLFADKKGSGNAEFQIAYSRGNTIEGADITRHVKHLDFPKIINAYSFFVVRAELIMRDDIFRTKYDMEYSSARALVSGKMNAKESEESILKDIDLIAYSVIDYDGTARKPSNLNKLASFNILKNTGFKIPFVQTAKGNTISEQFLSTCILQSKAASKYELDGVVVSDNKTGSSIKYKMLDLNSIAKSEFAEMPIEISKWGVLKPRIKLLNPPKLYDTIVTYCTAFNMQYVHDNKIGPGSIMEVTKSGSVIPFILGNTPSTINNYDNWFNQQLDLVAGKDQWKWNDSGVEVILKDFDSHPIVKFKQVLDFFESLEVDLLKEATLDTIFKKFSWNDSHTSYEKIIETIFDLSESEWEKIVGKNGLKIYSSLHRRLSNMKLETLCGSLNYCGVGFGIRRAKILLEQIDVEKIWDLSKNDIVALNGFDEKTATKIVDGLPKIKQFLDKNLDYIKIIKETKTNELAALSVVFTGFRDDALEEKIHKMGGKVGTGVSKKTTHVIAADVTSNSGKAGKARALGVVVMGVDEFKDAFNL